MFSRVMLGTLAMGFAVAAIAGSSKKYPVHIDRRYRAGQQCNVKGSIVSNFNGKVTVGYKIVKRIRTYGTYRFSGNVTVDVLNQLGDASQWSIKVKRFDYTTTEGKAILVPPGSIVKGTATKPGEPTNYRVNGKALPEDSSDIIGAFASAIVGRGVFLDEYFNSTSSRKRSESWTLDAKKTYSALKALQPVGLRKKKRITGKVTLAGITKIKGKELLMIRSSIRCPWVLGIEPVSGQAKNETVIYATQYRPTDLKVGYVRTKGKMTVSYAKRFPNVRDSLLDITAIYEADIETFQKGK